MDVVKTRNVYQLGVILFIILDIKIASHASRIFSGITREYCLADTFDPSCDPGEVVVMQLAHYGRMRVGRCVEMDRGALGCYSDELATFDEYCSGQQTCSIGIYDESKITTELSCLNELKPYLEAQYTCQKVHSPRSTTCSGPEIVPVANKEIFISSQVSLTSSCGSHSSPWLLETKPGQKINISLLDFGWDQHVSGHVGCKVKYGYLLDVSTDDIINICGGSERTKHLYISAGSHVQVVLDVNNQENHPFLLEVKALGCPDRKVPSNAWREEVNNSLVIGCETSETSWKLKCVDGVWLGIVGTCPPPPTTTQGEQKGIKVVESEPYTLPPMTSNHVVAFGLGCLTVIVCCIVIMLGYYCTRRYESNYKMKRHQANTEAPVVRTLLRNSNAMTMKATLSRCTPTNTGTDLPTYSMALSKDQRPPPVPHRTSSYRGDMSESMMSDYLAPQGGDDNSVKYYILENPAEPGGKEEMYQSIHLFSSLERNPQENV